MPTKSGSGDSTDAPGPQDGRALNDGSTSAAPPDERYRQMFERNRAIKLLIDPASGEIIDANSAAAEFYGYPLDVLRGMNIAQINILSAGEVAEEMERARGEERNYFLFKHTLASGELRDVEVHSSPVEVEGKTLLYSIVHDITDRRLAEQRLAQSVSLLRATLDSTADGILALDSSGRIAGYNSKFAQMWNMPPGLIGGGNQEEVMAHLFTMVVDAGQFRDRLLEIYDRAEDRAGSTQDTIHIKDGRVFEVYSQQQRLSGNVVGRVWSFRDVTQRVRAEDEVRRLNSSLEHRVAERTAQLEEANSLLQREIAERRALEAKVRGQAETLKTEYERMAAVVSGVELALVMMDREGRITLANDAWLRRTGLQLDEIIGRPYGDLPGEALAPQMDKIVERVVATGQPFYRRELRVPSSRYAGGWMYLDISILPVTATDGTVAGLAKVSVDVTEKVLARREIEAQRGLLETIIQTVPVGIVRYDCDMRVLNCNTTWCEYMGVSQTEVLGQVVYDVVPALDAMQEYHRRALEGETLDVTGVALQRDGESEVNYFDIALVPMAVEGGEVTGLLSVAINMTGREELDQQKDQFIALASHELKSPITAIKGFAQLAETTGRKLGNDRLARMLSTINQQASRLTRMIDDMLDVSRMQGGAFVLEHSPFDLSSAVREALENAEVSAPEFTFNLELPDGTVAVQGDRVRTEQVISNLLQNAVKYSGSSRVVDVSLTVIGRPDGEQENTPEAIVAVRDYGIGIPAQQRDRIFERFFRASNAQEGHAGLGLGLFIAHGIVQRHGGRIWLDSVEGKGTTFYFMLPLDPQAGSSPNRAH